MITSNRSLAPPKIPVTSHATPTPAATPPHAGRYGLVVLAVLFVAGAAYISSATEDARAAGIPSVVAEYATWIALLAIAMVRSPGGTLRVSDPFLMLLGLGFNFLVTPGINWLHGLELDRDWFELGRIRMGVFIQLQWLHIMFMVALSATYFALAPRHAIAPFARDPREPLPDGRAWIALGLLPFAIGVVQRVLTTGTLAATQNYGQIWTTEHAALNAVRAEGGSALVATQFFGKVWFLPWLMFGIGEGLVLARLLRNRRRLPLVLFALQAPVLLFLNSGGRSVIVAPFLIALLIADVLVGPVRWRWVLSLGAVSMVGLNFFGIYRAYRERDFDEAFAIANERFNSVSRTESLSAESSIMLMKEHFAVAWTDANNYSRGLSYFTENVLSLLPQQLVPEKLHYMNTTTFLTREFLGSAADAGGGVAGAMIADGYMIGRELGVVVLGIVLGGIAGGITRLLATGTGSAAQQPMLWQVILLVSWSQQGIPFFRNDLAVVISQLGSVVVIPAVCFALWVSLVPHSRWAARVPSFQLSRRAVGS